MDGRLDGGCTDGFLDEWIVVEASGWLDAWVDDHESSYTLIKLSRHTIITLYGLPSYRFPRQLVLHGN